MATAVGLPRAARAAPAVLAAWYRLFPQLTGYVHTFSPVVVGAESSYRQSATYLWTGNADRMAEIVYGVDPRSALRRDTRGHFEDLGRQRFVWIRRTGGGPFEPVEPLLVELTRTSRVAQLSTKPRVARAPTVADVRRIRPGDAIADVDDWLGAPQNDIGSGIHVFTYHLRDGTATVGSSDGSHVLYAHTAS